MKNNHIKIWKLLIKGLVYLGLFGLFAGFVIFLNRASTQEVKEEMDWSPEARQDIPGGWELAA